MRKKVTRLLGCLTRQGQWQVPAHAAASRSGDYSGVVWKTSCRNFMFRQDGLHFIKALSNLQHSTAILKELRMTLSRRKKPLVLAGSCSTTSGDRIIAPIVHRYSSRAKRKANDSSEPANRRPAPDTGSATLPASSTEVQVGTCSLQIVTPEAAVTYAATLAGPVTKWFVQAHSHGNRQD